MADNASPLKSTRHSSERTLEYKAKIATIDRKADGGAVDLRSEVNCLLRPLWGTVTQLK
ncbi:hypothetical protein [[Actinomadura] parvosata]|uniref:hypothetical protein n=1 Tax=[Actinomadura] parvosata TaxID=1955412 RepID=UPI0012BC41FD|nr:hypothetical protein [Nonomuraea sp. ATCC 55076]